jgi:hypothetical protein
VFDAAVVSPRQLHRLPGHAACDWCVNDDDMIMLACGWPMKEPW